MEMQLLPSALCSGPAWSCLVLPVPSGAFPADSSPGATRAPGGPGPASRWASLFLSPLMPVLLSPSVTAPWRAFRWLLMAVPDAWLMHFV